MIADSAESISARLKQATDGGWPCENSKVDTHRGETAFRKRPSTALFTKSFTVFQLDSTDLGVTS